MMRIAILEDDRTQGFLLQRCLLEAGHAPKRYERGTELIEAIETDDFDALLLDWSIPDLEGIEVLSQVRKGLKSNVPIILITSRTSEEDVVHALSEGADGYVSTRVGNRELVARLESVARRSQKLQISTESFEAGQLRVDVAARRIYRGEQPIELSAKDFDLAVMLLRNIGRLFSRSQISETVWGREAPLRSRTLDTHISHVRTRLFLTEAYGWRLGAVYGHGYRLDRLGARTSAISKT
jgi:DNA-binding response OmpR family regulator